jgi:hypothetical protein
MQETWYIVSAYPSADISERDAIQSLLASGLVMTPSVHDRRDIGGSRGVSMSVKETDLASAAHVAVTAMEKALADQSAPERIDRVDVMAEDHAASRPTLRLIGLEELAATLGVSKRRAGEISRAPSFPKPAAELACGPVWDYWSLRKTMREWDGQPRSAAARSIASSSVAATLTAVAAWLVASRRHAATGGDGHRRRGAQDSANDERQDPKEGGSR